MLFFMSKFQKLEKESFGNLCRGGSRGPAAKQYKMYSRGGSRTSAGEAPGGRPLNNTKCIRGEDREGSREPSRGGRGGQANSLANSLESKNPIRQA